MPAGGDIKIGGTSVLSENSNLHTEEFFVSGSPGQYFGTDPFNSSTTYLSSFSRSNIDLDSWLFPLAFTPNSPNKVMIYIDGYRIPKFDDNGQLMYQIVNNALHLFIDNFPSNLNLQLNSFDFSGDNIYRINIDYQY